MNKDRNKSDKKEVKTMNAALDKYNIRDTKQYYSEINDKVLKGMEVITFNATKKLAEVSHISTAILDEICDRFVIFHPCSELDEELGVWTVSLNEINMYGEGKTEDEAIQDLINAIVEFSRLYKKKYEYYSMVEAPEVKVYMRKIARCEGDREKIKKAIGL
jgi:hypothetical protein